VGEEQPGGIEGEFASASSKKTRHLTLKKYVLLGGWEKKKIRGVLEGSEYI